MLSRLGVPVLLVALLLPLGAVHTASAAPAPGVTARASAVPCEAATLSDRAAIRTRAGVRLGTARVYVTPKDDEVAFCVRVTPVERLRSRDTAVFVRHRALYPDGERGPSMTLEVPWTRPLVMYGTFEPGSGLAATVVLRTPAGVRGSGRLTATVR